MKRYKIIKTKSRNKTIKNKKSNLLNSNLVNSNPVNKHMHTLNKTLRRIFKTK